MEDRPWNAKHSNENEVIVRKPLRQSDARKRYRKRIETPHNALQLVQQSMAVLTSQLKELVSSAVDEKLSRLQPPQKSGSTTHLKVQAASSAQPAINALMTQQLRDLVSVAIDEKLSTIQPVQQSRNVSQQSEPVAASSTPKPPATLTIWLESVELKQEIDDVLAVNGVRDQHRMNEIIEIIDVDHDYAMAPVIGEKNNVDHAYSINSSTSCAQQAKKVYELVEQETEVEPLATEDLSYRFKAGIRFGQLLYTTSEKQLYRPKNGIKKQFVCRMASCSAALYMEDDGALRRTNPGQTHNHCNQEQEALHFGFTDACRTKGAKSRATPKVLNKNVLNNFPLEEDTSLYPQTERTLRRQRKKATAVQSDPETSVDTDDELTGCASPKPTQRSRPRVKRPFLIADPLESLRYKYISGVRFGSKLLYSIDERQLYCRKVVYADRSKFRCAVPSCSATVYMYGDVLRHLSKYIPHNHVDQEHRMRSNSFLAACKLECKRSGGTVSLPQVYAKVAEKLPSADIPLQLVSQKLRGWKGRPRVHRQFNPRPTAVVDVDEVLPYTFTVGARAGSTMLYSTSEKQLYRLKNQLPHRKRYVCRSPKCMAALYLHDDGGLRRSPGFVPHVHEPQDRVALRIMFASACRKECLETGRDPREVYDELVEKFPLGGEQIEFEHLRRHLTRLSQKRRNELNPVAVRPKTPPLRLVADPAEYMPYRFTPGGRMGAKLLYSLAEKQLYRLKLSNANERKFYACRVTQCPAVVYMREGVLSRQPLYRAHNHGDQEEVARRLEFAHACRVECARPGASSARQVYNAMLEKYSMDSTMVPYQSLKKQLIRYVKGWTPAVEHGDAKQPNEEEQGDAGVETEMLDMQSLHAQNYCFEEYLEDESMGHGLDDSVIEPEFTNASVADDVDVLLTGPSLLIVANEEMA